MRIDPDGKVTVITVRPMNMEAKMQEIMKKLAQPVTKGLRVWFDQKGQLTYHIDPDAVSRAMNEMKK